MSSNNLPRSKRCSPVPDEIGAPSQQQNKRLCQSLSTIPNHESLLVTPCKTISSTESLSTTPDDASLSTVSSYASLSTASSYASLSTASSDASLSTASNDVNSITSSDDNLYAIHRDNTAVTPPDDESFLSGPKLIRVGPQPLQPQKHIISAPEKFAEEHIKRIIKVNLNDLDSRLPNTTPEIGKADAKDLFFALKSSLCLTGNLATRACDYTGVQLSWSEGPSRVSLEAIYPYVIKGDRIAYHANPNVCFIAHSTNSAKRRHPAILLALIAAWFNSAEDIDLKARQARQAWIYNALCNVSSLEHIFHLTLPHSEQMKRWEKWPLEQQMEALEAMRTGTRSELVNQLLSGISEAYLFHSSRKPLSKASGKEIAVGTIFLETLATIGEKQGLTREEFLTFLTIQAPDRSERVFYPFHVLSRPQAKENGWDWNAVTAFGRRLTRALKDQCNRHAEAAGHGEADLNETTMVYWLAAYLSNQIAEYKMNNPAAEKTQILWNSMLDRWGLPMVPWVRHVLRMSLCKGPDHGIAMLLGFLPTNGKIFDPLEHINLSLRTVELDSWFTNSAMRNFAIADWDWIRTTLRKVPLHHCFWRVDKDLGNFVWNSKQICDITPKPPQPSFEMLLVPIEHWFSKGPDMNVLHQQCSICEESFSSIGLLLRHCQENHCSDFNSNAATKPEPEQANIDQVFWDTYNVCPECGSRQTTASNLKIHIAIVHTKTAQAKCDKCDKVLCSKSSLRRHKKAVHGE